MAHGYPDFEGDKSGLYLKPEWAAKEGTDKDFWSSYNGLVYSEGIDVLYNIPAGKRFYLMQVSAKGKAAAAEDGDNNQIVSLIVYEGVGPDTYWGIAGNGGDYCSFLKPIVFTAGQRLVVLAEVWANHAIDLEVSAQGYEV